MTHNYFTFGSNLESVLRETKEFIVMKHNYFRFIGNMESALRDAERAGYSITLQLQILEAYRQEFARLAMEDYSGFLFDFFVDVLTKDPDYSGLLQLGGDIHLYDFIGSDILDDYRLMQYLHSFQKIVPVDTLQVEETFSRAKEQVISDLK